MCLAIPMRIKKIEGDFALVEAGGFVRRINIQMLKEIRVGDYVLVHAGFAIEKVSPENAQKTLRILNEIH